ncbi:MAG: hypothetical protein ABF409_05995, partial [Bifidobacterium sp.]|uniref:hypothetical protein n=1 Tax=Bifidobacterium sp. TaxID=41200 RepID=UPI0039EBE00D
WVFTYKLGVGGVTTPPPNAILHSRLRVLRQFECIDANFWLYPFVISTFLSLVSQEMPQNSRSRPDSTV